MFRVNLFVIDKTRLLSKVQPGIILKRPPCVTWRLCVALALVHVLRSFSFVGLFMVESRVRQCVCLC